MKNINSMDFDGNSRREISKIINLKDAVMTNELNNQISS